jgi:fatty-acyl-CoA synthase
MMALATPLLFLVAAVGSKYGLWDWRFGLGVMTRDWGPPVAIIGMVACALAMLLWIRPGPRWPIAVLVLAVLAPALCLFGLRQQQRLVLALPAIHDVQTDWSDPIQFSDEALSERARSGATNPVSAFPIIVDDGRRGRWAGMSFAEAQTVGYPDIGSASVPMDLASAHAVVLEALADLGIEVRRSWVGEREAGIEAVATTFWYGLEDDVAVRLRSIGRETTQIDVRSISREGHIDLGVNAERVRRIIDLAKPSEQRQPSR